MSHSQSESPPAKRRPHNVPTERERRHYNAKALFNKLCLLNVKRPDLLSLGQGAAQQNISQQVIKGFKFLLPELSILDQFNSGVEPMFREIELLLKSNKNLKKQRDLLLPKLISGKIEI